MAFSFGYEVYSVASQSSMDTNHAIMGKLSLITASIFWMTTMGDWNSEIGFQKWQFEKIWEIKKHMEDYDELVGLGGKLVIRRIGRAKNEIEPRVVSDKGWCSWVPTRVACGMIGWVTSLTAVVFSRLLPNKPFAAGFRLSLEAPTHSGIWQGIAEIYISLLSIDPTYLNLAGIICSCYLGWWFPTGQNHGFNMGKTSHVPKVNFFSGGTIILTQLISTYWI